MSIESSLMPIEECRSFVAALNIVWQGPTYIAVEKRSRFSVYSNSFEKQPLFRTQEIVETAQRCFAAIEALKSNTQERYALLVHLRKGLRVYKKKLQPGLITQVLCGFFYEKARHQISLLRATIKGELESTTQQEKPNLGEGVQGLLQQITALSSKLASMKDLEDEKTLADFTQKRIEEILSLREQSAEFPWKECYYVAKKLLSLQQEIRTQTKKQIFHIRQKKELAETKALVERILKELTCVEAEFNKKLAAIQGDLALQSLLWWIELYPSGNLRPLRKNRFLHLTQEDALCPAAVKVSQEIALCKDYAKKLEISFHEKIDKRNVPPNFQEIMKAEEEQLIRAEQLAKGDEKLSSAIALLKQAIEKNAPELFFSLEKLPSDQEGFETSVKRMRVLLHPDKYRNCSEAATILFEILGKIATWILENKYKKEAF